MGYQLMVWEGERPHTDEAGRDACGEIMDRYFDGVPAEPTPGIRAFVAALTEVWPQEPDDPGWDLCPWGGPSLIDDASGPALWVILPSDVGVLASCIIAAVAEERGLVVFDPQVGLLRPVSEEIVAEYHQRSASALN